MEKFSNVFLINNKLYTKNLVPGKKVHGEKLLNRNGKELRSWHPYKSKLASAILKGLKELPITPGSKVLYLGASTGTTASHVSDIADKNGKVVCVEYSEKPMEKLIPLAEKRSNMLPVMGDANKPKEYTDYCQDVNVVYQDVAQPNQAEILLKNTRFLEKGDEALLCIKSRSINAVEEPKKVFEKEISKLRKDFRIKETLELKPFHKDHAFIRCKKKSATSP